MQIYTVGQIVIAENDEGERRCKVLVSSINQHGKEVLHLEDLTEAKDSLFRRFSTGARHCRLNEESA